MTTGLVSKYRLARALCLWLCFAGAPAFAQTVTALSGEHDGFTRIVLDYGAPVDWTVGRMPDGYALRVTGGTSAYDLSEVFNRIGKSRLGAIWADPETGDLVFSANCACHAIAFEFRPGTVVIDLKDGPPPKGSGFESALANTETGSDDGLVLPTPDSVTKPHHQPVKTAEAIPEFDWITAALSSPVATPVTARTEPERSASEAMPSKTLSSEPHSAATKAALTEFEENLRAELAGAATSGIVDLAKPDGVEDTVTPAAGEVLDQFRIGRKGEAGLGQVRTRKADLGADGDLCATADSLDIASWGDPQKAVADQIADMRSGLVGEFDAVDPEKFSTAIKFYLYLGFGTEVRDLMAAFSPNDPDSALWSAMARVLEGEEDTSAYFAPMLACQGPAALWAIIASNGQPVAGFDRQPVFLAFSALPVHLRRHLGPRLVDRFLAMGDAEGARILSDAIFRPGATDAPGIDLMKARISLNNGNAVETEAILRDRIAEGGPDQADAYFALVELMVQRRKPIRPDEALAIAALADEHPDNADLGHLLALSQAASGNFDAAFARTTASGRHSGDIWGLLAVLGTDDDLLRHAVLAADDRPGDVVPAEAVRIAERLLGLGLARDSARWQEWAGAGASNPASDLLGRRTSLALGHTAEAMAGLEAVAEPDETTRELLVQAKDAAGDLAGRAAILDPADPRKATTLGRAGDWRGLAQIGEGPWAALAEEIVGTRQTTATEGALARSASLVEARGQSRNRILSLLDQTAKPESE
jgi:hypothetical protein